MTRTVDQVIAGLDAFQPSKDETENIVALSDILEGFEDVSGKERALPVMLGLLERFPEAELGAPGPIVHALEGVPGYELSLRESVGRRPTSLTVWMVHRILNSQVSLSERAFWLAVLQTANEHPAASGSLKARIQRYLAHQASTPG